VKDFDLLDYENQIWQQEQGFTISKPRVDYDYNWAALKAESLEPPKPMPAEIERTANVKALLYASNNYQKGKLTLDVYRQGIKENLEFNMLTEVLPELTPRQYKVWDLVITDSHLSGCKAQRYKIYPKDCPENYINELAVFTVWKEHTLLWSSFLVEDWIIPMRSRIEEYYNSGNFMITAAWANRQLITDWYQKNI
jgi:hypothetical protein